MQEKKPQTLGEIWEEMRNTPPELLAEIELSYRRGFHQGWDDAIGQIFHMFRDGISTKDAYALSSIYVHQVVKWRTDEENHPGCPPSFKLAELQEALKQIREKATP